MTKYIIFLGFSLRLTNSFINSYLFITPGAGMDARGLHGFASDVSSGLAYDPFQIGFTPYTNFLGTIYYIFTDSIFLGGFVSCLAWLASAILLFKTLNAFSINKNIVFYSLFIYSLLPSSILFTSITLREVYQLLFINISLYSYAQIYIYNKARYYLLFFISIFCMSVLHGALLLFGAFTIFFSIFAILLAKKSRDAIKKYGKVFILMCLIVLPVGFYALDVFTQISKSYDVSEGIFFAVEIYQNNLIREDARSTYISEYEFTSLKDFLFFLPFNFFQYFMEPFPWRIANIFDLLVFSENALRAFILLMAIRQFNYIEPNIRPCVAGFLISFLFLELVWSVGTVNWGTAIRHHIPSLGLLIICFAVARNAFILFANKKCYENNPYN